MRGSLVATPEYLRQHGEPQTPEALLTHEALLQGAERWRFMDGDKIVTVHQRGRFKADNGTALVPLRLPGSASRHCPIFSLPTTLRPVPWCVS
jgi:hypothetical protein